MFSNPFFMRANNNNNDNNNNSNNDDILKLHRPAKDQFYIGDTITLCFYFQCMWCNDVEHWRLRCLQMRYHVVWSWCCHPLETFAANKLRSFYLKVLWSDQPLHQFWLTYICLFLSYDGLKLKPWHNSCHWCHITWPMSEISTVFVIWW